LKKNYFQILFISNEPIIEIKVCFWKFCAWQSDQSQEILELLYDRIKEKIDKYQVKPIAPKKANSIQIDKKDKEREKIKRINELAHLFSRFY
jgi:hypothetical protein